MVGRNLIVMDTVDEVRDLDEKLRRKTDVIVLETTKLYTYIPSSLEADDGDTWLEPTDTDCDCCQGRGRWKGQAIGGGTGDGGDGGGPTVDLCDDDPEALGDVASPGASDQAARCDHVHPNTGLATDVELSAEASTRASADSTEATARAAADTSLAAAVTAEAATRAAADSSEAATRAAADSSEASTRAAADTTEATTRAANDDNESVGREMGDSGLRSMIATEAAKRRPDDACQIIANQVFGG